MKTVYLKFWLPVIVLILTSLLIVGMFFYQTTIQAIDLKQQKIAKIEAAIPSLQIFVENALLKEPFYLPAVERKMAELGLEPEPAILALINPQRLIQHTSRNDWIKKTTSEVIPEITANSFHNLTIRSHPDVEISDEPVVISAYIPIRFPDPTAKPNYFSYGLFYISYDLTKPLAAIHYQVFTQSILFWLCCVILMLIFTLILNRLVNMPILHLISVMQHCSTDKETRSTLTGQGELAILGDSFNNLIDRLIETQNNLSKQKNLYALLSATNQIIIRTLSQQQLFDDVCQSVIKQPHLVLAWIGLTNHDIETVDILAHAGVAADYLSLLSISTNPVIAEGQGPTAMAIRENCYVITNRFLHDPLADAAGNENVRSSAVFPICKFNEVVGAFNIYADQTDYFSKEIVDLLDEMAHDISYALGALELEQRRKLAEAEVERLAYYDTLTCLPNRRMLSSRLADEIVSSKRIGTFGALLFLDLDHFKNLNDSLGHAIGDELLVQLAERLKSQLREADLAARLGGDEFVVLLSNLSDNLESAINNARKVTEKILTTLREPYTLKNHHYHSNSSIGVTLFPQEQQDAAAILKQADTALYRAKSIGRNTFQFYHPQMQEAAYKRLEMEKNLRIALSEDQLQLYFQPQFDHLHQLVGAEVLLRWIHPEIGFIPPDQFIPIAEEAGIIVEIGDWIFKHVFERVKTWQESGLLKSHQHISINVSPKQFEQNNFFKLLSKIVAKSGVNASSIILELTEGAFLTSIDRTIEKMLQIRSLGFTFSIDDFGTGYSSLAYLKRLPLNELKIDKAFVDDIEHDSDDRAIVETVIAMAQHLKLTVIAEGVETQQQFDFLKENGCLHYQGYFFSRPLDQNTFENYLRQHL